MGEANAGAREWPVPSRNDEVPTRHVQCNALLQRSAQVAAKALPARRALPAECPRSSTASEARPSRSPSTRDELDKILHHGVNSLIALSIDGREELALCRQVHRHPVRPVIMHVDFIRVQADVAVEAEVALNLTGESEGVRNGGLLDQLMFSISISANPGSIPTSIDYDISAMTLGDQLHARDLVLPADVTLLLEPGELLAQISVPAWPHCRGRGRRSG